MRHAAWLVGLLAGLVAVAACGGDGSDTAAATTGSGAGGSGSGGLGAGGAGVGGEGGAEDKAALCTDTFGDALTNSFGRLDGTVLAVVQPSDTQCPLFNDDHLVIEVSMAGAVYRMVVNIDAIGFVTRQAPLLAPAWAEGWHPDQLLDYPTDLSLHSGDFTTYSLDELSPLVTSYIEVGAPISVYAESSGGTYASSAHLVHRNNSKSDGAIVIDPAAAQSTYLLFRFDNQQF